MATISVVIPAFNSEAHIERALNSIEKQTKLPYEVIVIDDGSTDETFEKAVSHRLAALTNLKVFKKTNAGVSSARNAGINAATSAFIALLDSDDEFLPSHISDLSNAAESFPKAILIFSAVERVFDTVELAAREAHLPDFRKIALSHCNPLDKHFFKEMSQSLLKDLIKGNFITTSSSMFPRIVGGEVVQFNESLSVAEDRALFITFASMGKVVFIDKTNSKIYRTGNNISNGKNGLLHSKNVIKALESIVDQKVFHGEPQFNQLVLNEIHSKLDNLLYWASQDGLSSTLEAITISSRLGKSFSPNLYTRRFCSAAIHSLKNFKF